MTTLFISDLHLDPQRPAVIRAFFDFLQGKARDSEALYILGDLFEAWIGDDDPSTLARETIAALRNLSDAGTSVYLMRGNRDFMIGKGFARQTGCELLPDYAAIDLYGRKTLLLHGDTLCTEDINYQKFRRKVRNPLVWWAIRCLPLSSRQKLAAHWRSGSMTANANKPDNIMDVTLSEIERLLKKHNCSTIIHGHTHRPGRHSQENGERFVLGDWDQSGWYIEASPSQLEIISFPIAT